MPAATLVAAIAAGHLLGSPSRARMFRATVGALLAFAAFRIGEAAVAATVGLPERYGYHASAFGDRLLSLLTPMTAVDIAWALTRAALVLGWCGLPVFVVTRTRLSASTLTGAIALAIVLVTLNKPMPLMGNILYERGLGPVMVPGIEGRGPFWAWWALTGVAIIGAAFVAEISLRSFRALWHTPSGAAATPARAIRVAGLISMWGLVLAHAFVNLFDRYLLAALPPLILLTILEHGAAGRGKAVRLRSAATLLIVFAAFAIIATRDHMEWQRARWDVIRGVLAQGVPPVALDGGYEYNGEVRNIGFAPSGPPITHHIALVDEIPADALLCVHSRPLIGPRATAICARPGVGDRSRPQP